MDAFKQRILLYFFNCQAYISKRLGFLTLNIIFSWKSSNIYLQGCPLHHILWQQNNKNNKIYKAGNRLNKWWYKWIVIWFLKIMIQKNIIGHAKITGYWKKWEKWSLDPYYTYTCAHKCVYYICVLYKYVYIYRYVHIYNVCIQVFLYT